MPMPYRARVDERAFLNLPGFHGGAYVYTYVEDTSDRGLRRGPYCEPDCTCGSLENFEPRIVLAIADCDSVINLTFDVDSAAYRENSLHKIDTLVAALRVFRAALVEEFEPYERRARELADSKKSPEEDEPPVGEGPPVAPTHDTVAEKARHAPAQRDTAVRVCPVSLSAWC